MGHTGDVVVGQVDTSQSSVVRESFRWQFSDEVLLQAPDKRRKGRIVDTWSIKINKNGALTVLWCHPE